MEQAQATILNVPIKHRFNRRKLTITLAILATLVILAILITGSLSSQAAVKTSFLHKNHPPGLDHFLGTDWLGRDMLARTLKGLSLSVLIGLGASTVSAFLALFLGVVSATFGGKIDALVSWGVDVVMGLPHLMLLILVSYALGKGLMGVTVAVAISHWPNLTRVIRAEITQLKAANYILIPQKLGHGPFYIARRHMLPHVFPQFLVGLILLFPHAILHEASVTFLGFGLSSEQPGIGIILSESMKYLSLGYWWLSVFPGLALLATVLIFDRLGHYVRELIDPHSVHD
ncbi:MAG: ABC transporter permease [Deltaproteobacteria bacterium]|jgi:peptide/nickel transport system permease protein|nr:ABC transporter permease [Deltaproteobacteria bacterium]